MVLELWFFGNSLVFLLIFPLYEPQKQEMSTNYLTLLRREKITIQEIGVHNLRISVVKKDGFVILHDPV